MTRMQFVFSSSQQYAHRVYNKIARIASTTCIRYKDLVTFPEVVISYMTTPVFTYKRQYVPRSLRWLGIRYKYLSHTPTNDIATLLRRRANSLQPFSSDSLIESTVDVPLLRTTSEHECHKTFMLQHEWQTSYVNSYLPNIHVPFHASLPNEPLPPSPFPAADVEHITSTALESGKQLSASTYQHQTIDMDVDTSDEIILSASQDNKAEQWSTNTNTLPSKPVNRKWIKMNFGETFQNRNDVVFTLMSYNILAQCLIEANSNLYSFHDPDSLKWPHRLPCLLKEIANTQPDILNLQEVQEDHLNDIVNHLKEIGLTKYLYKKRSGDQKDGCAIFYNGDIYELIDHAMVEYLQPNIRILNRANVAIIAKFALKCSPRTQFIVATTHLLYNPRRNDVRLAQTQLLLAELDRLSCRKWNNRDIGHDRIPIILTGDFNLQSFSEPYKLITENFVSLDRIGLSSRELLPFALGITDNCQHIGVIRNDERRRTTLFNSERQGPREDEYLPYLDYQSMRHSRLPFNTGHLTHSLNLTSAFGDTNRDRHYFASTYHRQWITVDYIFYTKFWKRSNSAKFSPLQLLSYLELPTVAECTNNGPIPNAYLGSDHYSLAARFCLKKHN